MNARAPESFHLAPALKATKGPRPSSGTWRNLDGQRALFGDADASPSPPTVTAPTRPSSIGQVSVSYAHVREILTRATGFMDAYDFTLNPYSGCFFGCTYCYAAFFSRSKEERDRWGRWVKVKGNAVDVMGRHRPGSLDGKLIYMSSVTDPYQPIERELRLTRGLLEIMAERHRPRLVIQTRSADVTRDTDLLRRIEERGGRVQVNMTVTTDDEDVRRTFEPQCPSNPARLRAIAEVRAAGVDTCVTMTPLLLVSRPYEFAEDLLETGVQKFIIQPFHFQRGKFVAATRESAIDLMTSKLGCDRAAFRDRYMESYERAESVLDERLPQLGRGKDGFAPPF